MTEASLTYREDHVSQIPALQLLINLGFTYLTPEEVMEQRGNRRSNVLLEGILSEQLRSMNKVRAKGKEYPFTEGNIYSAVQGLKEVIFDGLIRTNEKVYDLICLGKSLQQSIDGDQKSFTIKYIDWDEPANNVFHCAAEFEVEKPGTYETRRPDIILFVNGIPLVVIECKSPKEKDPIKQAVSQQIRNQKGDEIPSLFIYSQLLLAISMDEAMFATAGTAMKFWSVWKEQFNRTEQSLIRELANRPLTAETKKKLFIHDFRYARKHFEALEQSGDRQVTEQDRTLYSLCRPERLLELAYRYTVFDAGEKKVARYQQFFCVKKIMNRVKELDRTGGRKGGVVWHTQGSGKSLTMVMLAKALALDPAIKNPRIVIVTDRVDLDDQIWGTFRDCGKEPEQAKTGRHLIEMLTGGKEKVIATVIDKFEAGVGVKDVLLQDSNIFVLVDEAHRTQYGSINAKMQKVLPNACFIAFTGTPVAKKQRNTVERFGGLIDTYTIKQAERDKAVVPLLYEGRDAPQLVNAKQIDSWFDKLTEGLSVEQKADLKRKFASKDQLNKAEQKVARIAWDISVHFRDNWQGTGFKGQLVTQDKATALLYKKHLDDFGMVSSEVIISSPDDREGEEDIYSENTQEVVRFWKAMMDKYGTEKQYNKQLINAFKHGETPEIIIVVDKLLVGFDATRNTVLYLTRNLKDHTLLQAIARVNRLHDGKEFGYIIDYRGVLENLDKAIDLYGSLDAFDAADLEGVVTDIDVEIAKLPQRHSELWDVFKGIENKHDLEAYERLLFDEAHRAQFYEKFTAFARTLAIALSSANYLAETPSSQIDRYQKDLGFFKNLRHAVKRRYAEEIDYADFEPKIRKLIDTHVGTGEVELITPLVNIFDEEAFAREVEKVIEPAAKADTIAHRTKMTIHERWQEDPTFYQKFSKVLQDAIDAFRAERIKAAEYLAKVQEVMQAVINRSGDDIPEILSNSDVAKAFYGSIKEIFEHYTEAGVNIIAVSSDAAIGLEDRLEKHRIVNWTTNTDVQNRMKNEMEDFLFELKSKHKLDLAFEDIDTIMEQCLDIFKVRRP